MRAKYKSDRVLIDAERILDSPFDGDVLQFTGAHIELMRNLTQYLHREKTFVDVYAAGYYETPDTADMDAINAIVSDLEEILMGNENTVFGYSDRYLEHWSNSEHAAGTQLLETMPVPAGYVYVVQHIYTVQLVTSGSWQSVVASDDTDDVYIDIVFPVVAGVQRPISTSIILKEGDYLRSTWGNTAIDELLEFGVWGYKMKV